MINVVLLLTLGLVRSAVLDGFLSYTWNIYVHNAGYSDASFSWTQGMVAGLVLQVVGSFLYEHTPPTKETDEMLAWHMLVTFASSIGIALTWALVALLQNWQ